MLAITKKLVSILRQRGMKELVTRRQSRSPLDVKTTVRCLNQIGPAALLANQCLVPLWGALGTPANIERHHSVSGPRATLASMGRMLARTGVAPNPTLGATSRQITRYIDALGRPLCPISPVKAAGWEAQGESPQLGHEARAWAEVWYGEYLLGTCHEPESAFARFQRAIALAPAHSAARGIGAYDRALTLYRSGRYADAAADFAHLLRSDAQGYDRKDAALARRHAEACAGYHADRERIGIAEPGRLDPLCAAAGMAVVLRKLHMPFGEANVLSKVAHDGEGSSMQDIVDAAPRFGLQAHAVSATEKGLRLLFSLNENTPVIAHVEHDHFIALTSADSKGLTYVCSDCGKWPGGPREVSWRQWRAMEPDAYAVFARPGTPMDGALSSLGHDKESEPSACGRPERIQGIRSISQIIAALEGQVTLFLPLGAAICGWLPAGLQCTCPICCPMDAGPQAFTPGASSDGDPVNLATGGEEYAPPADFKIYNPIGPSISWARTYNSLSNTTENGFGGGWSHPLNICVFDSGQNSKQQQQQNSGDALRPVPGGGGATSYLVLANSAQIPFTLPSTAPTASNPSVACTVATGYPYLVSWNYDTPSGSTYYVITLPDRTKLVTMTRAYSAAQPFQNIFGTPELFITQIVDRVGNYINLQWALRNNGTRNVGGLSSVTDSSGNALLTLAYDSDARFVSATDRYGRSVYYTCARFSNQNVPPNINRQWNDELTQVSAVVATGTSNPPVNFSYGYQNYGNGEGSEMVPYLHTITVPSPTGTGTSTSTINYNSYDGYITSIVDANGNTRTYTPTQSNVTQVTVTNSQGQTVYSYSSTFSSNMSESKFVNSSGKTVYTKTYSDSNSPYGMSTYTDGNNRAWSYTYDKFTSPLTAKTPKGTITTYTRSYENFALGELTSYQVGTKTAASIAYNEPSGLVQSFSGPIPGQTGTGQTQTTSYTYDALGNVTQVTMPGNNAASTRTYTFGYTTDGTYTQAEGLHQPITVTDPLGNVTHLRYDARKNTLSRTDPSGNKTTFTYNLADQKHSVVMPATGQTGTGNESTVLTYLYVGGPLSQVNAYDESNNLVRTVNMTYGAEAELLARSGSVENTSIQYDALYHKVLVKDGNSNATSLAFDQNGNLTSISYPGASGANYDKVQFTSHDPVGNALTRVDGNGQTATYTYGDADGKLSAVAYSGNSQSNVSITYDAYDRQSASTDGAGSSSYTYDDRDNVLTSSRTYTGLSQQSMSFAYYPDGSRETMVNPAGTWTYTYDAAGRSTGLVSPAGTLSASYYANSWESGRTLPNGTATTYTYNAVGAPASIQTLTSGNQVIAQYGTFKYDGVNNPLGLSATFSGVPTQTGTTSYTYDSYDRLTNETSQLSGGYNESFACDPAANLTTVRGASQGFDSDDQITGASFAYDGNGSPTTYAGNSLAFDVEARLIGEGANWSAGYRADGLRAWKQTSSGKTYYLYDQGEPVVELNSSGAVTGVNVFAHDGLVARSQGGTWTYYAFDALGNVGQRLNSSQSVVSSSSYDSYGAESNNGTPSDTFGYRARFGYVLDRETGFYYCRNRYYDPARGRWLSRDPIGFFGGINLYAYGRSAPNASVDPSGHYGLVLAGAGAGGGTIVLGGAGGTGVLGTTVGAGPIGIGIDNATGGGWGRFWCRVLGQDCEGTNELPAPTPDELCRARDELGPEPDFPDPDNDNSCADLATTVCGGYSGDTFFACAELITSLCLASGGAMTPEEAAEIAESNFGIPEVEEPEVDLPPMLPG